MVMTRKEVSRQLMASFLRMVNKYRAMEKFTMSYGTEAVFYHSERHLLDVMRDHPELNITELAQLVGVTKGAISQAVAKLERKGAIERYKGSGDDKQVLVRLTALGQNITEHHHQVNEQTVKQLCAVIKDRPQVEVDFLCEVFDWIEHHLDQGLERVEARHGG
jgi:DNA-binding MarR family transcriptional regulator